jgi:hypothetical protein
VKQNLVSLNVETSKYRVVICSGLPTEISEAVRGFHQFLQECTEIVIFILGE